MLLLLTTIENLPHLAREPQHSHCMSCDCFICSQLNSFFTLECSSFLKVWQLILFFFLFLKLIIFFPFKVYATLLCIFYLLYIFTHVRTCMNKWDSGLSFSPNISKIGKTHSFSFSPSLTIYLCPGKESPPPIYISLLTSSSTQDIFSPMTFLLFL